MIIREMREADCYAIVKREHIARLGCCKDNQPYIVPIHYAYADQAIYSFSMPGQKVDYMRENPKVCLQIDHLADIHHWKSVVIEGRFHELGSPDERERGWEVLQDRNDWWEPGALKPQQPQHILGDRQHLFFTISIERMSGRETA